MNRGELLTRLTVWLALCAYAWGAALLLVAKGRAPVLAGARWAWTAGCGFFVVHVVCAFAFFHVWSHDAAYRETARQTEGMTGLARGCALVVAGTRELRAPSAMADSCLAGVLLLHGIQWCGRLRKRPGAVARCGDLRGPCGAVGPDTALQFWISNPFCVLMRN